MVQKTQNDAFSENQESDLGSKGEELREKAKGGTIGQ